MTFEIGLLLVLIVVAIILFWLEVVPADVVALGLLITLAFTGLIPAQRTFDGFGNDAVIMILGLLILTAALERTGVVDLAGRAVLRFAGETPNTLLAVIMLAASGLSAFMSNTAATAFFVPIVIGVARKAGVGVSRLLLPLAFASILSSSVTLISTSTNLVVSGMMTNYKMPPMRMFELAPVGIPIAVVGLIYMFFIGRYLIPERAAAAKELTEQFGVRPYLSEVVVLPKSSLANRTLAEGKAGQALGLTVLQIVRNKHQYIAPRGNTLVLPGDVLLVEARRDDLLKIKDTAGVEIKADARLSDPDLRAGEMALVEGVVMPGSPLLGRTLKGFRFRERAGLQVLGVNHNGQNVVEKISQVPLGLGDVLLLQGRQESLRQAHEEGLFQLLNPIESMEEKRPRRRHAPLAIGIFAGVLALPTFTHMPFTLAVITGVVLVFLTRCITPEQAYRQVEWKAIILIGSMLGMGAAMEHTGAAKYLAGQIVGALGGANPLWLLSGFFVLTVLLTQPMSNQAAAIVILPIAIQTALEAGCNPRTFVMMVAVAASCSYLTPLEPSCLMVYGPGRYRFRDFVKVGSLLTILIYLVAIVLVPRVWPLR